MTIKKLNMNENKNEVALKKGTKYKDKEILKVLSVIVSEKETFYKCIMEDGSKQDVPASVLN